MLNKHNKQLHILGAGPAGLAAGYYAKKNNIPLILYEKTDQVGGNCKTFLHGRYRFDTGAHRFHDKYDTVTSEIRSLLGDELLEVNIPSKIFSNGRYIEFPLNLINLFNTLNFTNLFMIGFDNIINKMKINNNPNNFKDLAYQTYGKTLSELFLINYTKKLWGEDPGVLHTSISGNRLKNLDLFSVLRQSLGGIKKARHLDGVFYYPKFGFGSIFEKTKEFIGSENIKLNSDVKKLHHQNGKIVQIDYGDGKTANTSTVINSLPLNILLKILNPSPPKKIIDIVKSLMFRNLKLCICFLDIPYFSKNASIYFPEKPFLFTRIYEPKNRSSEMAPKGRTCIVIELPFSYGDKIDTKSENKLFENISTSLVENKLLKRDNIIDYRFMNIDYAYPVITSNIDENLGSIFSYLNTFNNMFHIGRSAEFKYLHTHSIFYNAEKLINQMLE